MDLFAGFAVEFTFNFLLIFLTLDQTVVFQNFICRLLKCLTKMVSGIQSFLSQRFLLELWVKALEQLFNLIRRATVVVVVRVWLELECLVNGCACTFGVRLLLLWCLLRFLAWNCVDPSSRSNKLSLLGSKLLLFNWLLAAPDLRAWLRPKLVHLLRLGSHLHLSFLCLTSQQLLKVIVVLGWPIGRLVLVAAVG